MKERYAAIIRRCTGDGRKKKSKRRNESLADHIKIKVGE
jgi:hypothetical protein